MSPAERDLSVFVRNSVQVGLMMILADDVVVCMELLQVDGQRSTNDSVTRGSVACCLLLVAQRALSLSGC